ncbi:MAG TPA: 50S ribosomal protein L22 [Candidatus Paceibacterota bacterium]|nr:50S ribosomal protein L22 [Candidatus Paceibacterota bacterium]HRZ34293.1 50S ribosomal protein L22 [Candidatus Paceibacterota bacterium]
MATAELKNHRQSPKKVRMVADVIRGKKVVEAIDMLTFVDKRSALPIQKLLRSAVANASHNHGLNKVEDLYIKEIRVDDGITFHRMMPRARGSGAPIKKRSSHIRIVLDVKAAPVAKGKKIENKK